MSDNLIDFELNRRTTDMSDLSQSRRGELYAECYLWEREFAFGGSYGFRQALLWIAGLGQKAFEEQEAQRFLERFRGKKEFGDFMRAAVAIQIKADRLRLEQDAQERRSRRDVQICDVSKTTRTDLDSKNPKLTKSNRSSPQRLRLVESGTEVPHASKAR